MHLSTAHACTPIFTGAHHNRVLAGSVLMHLLLTHTPSFMMPRMGRSCAFTIPTRPSLSPSLSSFQAARAAVERGMAEASAAAKPPASSAKPRQRKHAHDGEGEAIQLPRTHMGGEAAGVEPEEAAGEAAGDESTGAADRSASSKKGRWGWNPAAALAAGLAKAGGVKVSLPMWEGMVVGTGTPHGAVRFG